MDAHNSLKVIVLGPTTTNTSTKSSMTYKNTKGKIKQIFNVPNVAHSKAKEKNTLTVETATYDTTEPLSLLEVCKKAKSVRIE